MMKLDDGRKPALLCFYDPDNQLFLSQLWPIKIEPESHLVPFIRNLLGRQYSDQVELIILSNTRNYPIQVLSEEDFQNIPRLLVIMTHQKQAAGQNKDQLIEAIKEEHKPFAKKLLQVEYKAVATSTGLFSVSTSSVYQGEHLHLKGFCSRFHETSNEIELIFHSRKHIYGLKFDLNNREQPVTEQKLIFLCDHAVFDRNYVFNDIESILYQSSMLYVKEFHRQKHQRWLKSFKLDGDNRYRDTGNRRAPIDLLSEFDLPLSTLFCDTRINLQQNLNYFKNFLQRPNETLISVCCHSQAQLYVMTQELRSRQIRIYELRDRVNPDKPISTIRSIEGVKSFAYLSVLEQFLVVTDDSFLLVDASSEVMEPYIIDDLVFTPDVPQRDPSRIRQISVTQINDCDMVFVLRQNSISGVVFEPCKF